ncbi:hypothetical protein C5167_031305 [Papaver somniferum]|uniref:Uncharacterized protein n=1 Tax=Papaver somniferum TaxID=3469 RepID=A0A4Y7K558_PAPSO|nr:hypothetical protein C5167_031305 [Papaver somniferum]
MSENKDGHGSANVANRPQWLVLAHFHVRVTERIIMPYILTNQVLFKTNANIEMKKLVVINYTVVPLASGTGGGIRRWKQL